MPAWPGKPSARGEAAATEGGLEVVHEWTGPWLRGVLPFSLNKMQRDRCSTPPHEGEPEALGSDTGPSSWHKEGEIWLNLLAL